MSITLCCVSFSQWPSLLWLSLFRRWNTVSVWTNMLYFWRGWVCDVIYCKGIIAVMYFVCVRFICYWGTEGGATPPWVSDWAEQKWVVWSCLYGCVYRFIWIDCKWCSLDCSAVRVHPFLAQMFMKWWRRSTTTSRVQLKRSRKASEWFGLRMTVHINMSSNDIHTGD